MALYTLATSLVAMTAWLVLSTDLFIRPSAIHYNGWNVTLVRETPFGDVWGRWSTEIRVTGTGEECSSGIRPGFYQDTPDSTVSYRLGPWAQRCMDAGPPLVIVDTWQALIFGVIPVRPIHRTTVISIEAK
jgi:hypothetical protein